MAPGSALAPISLDEAFQLVATANLEHGGHTFLSAVTGLRELVEVNDAPGFAEDVLFQPHLRASRGLAVTVLILEDHPDAALLALQCDPSADGGLLAVSVLRVQAGDGALDAAIDALLQLGGATNLTANVEGSSDGLPRWAVRDSRGRTLLGVCVETRLTINPVLG